MRPFNEKGDFVPTPDGGELQHLAVQGAGATVLSNACSLGTQIMATVILARLLTPNDFGVVTMVTTFSLLLMSIGGNGFTEAVLQRAEVSHSLASNLFWINSCTGLALTLGFAAAGRLLASFFGNPHVATVAMGMSVTILVTSVAVLHHALLRRAMRFSATSKLDFLARAMSVTVSILLALAGFGYWALVGGAIAQALTQSIGAWYLCSWIPSLPRRVPGTSSMVRFAINVYGRFSLNYCARNLDNVLVGWRFDAQSLGFYKKAYDLFAVSTGTLVAPLTSVAVATLSRVAKDSVKYKEYLLRSLSMLALVGMGLGGYLTLIGGDLIRLLLGPGWEPAGRIFSFFGPGVGVMLIYYMHGWIHLSIGRPERWFRWGLIELGLTSLLFIMALPLGPSGIAMAWTVSFWVLTLPAFWYAGKPINFGLGPVIASIWKYLLSSVVAALASFQLVHRFRYISVAPGSPGAVTRILLTSFLFGVSYVAAVLIFHRGFGPIYQVRVLLLIMINRQRLGTRAPPAAGDIVTDDNLTEAYTSQSSQV